MRTYKNYIDGRFIEHKGDYIPVYNPATKEHISQIPSVSLDETKEAILSAKRAQKAWEARSAVDRASYLRKMAVLIRQNAKMLTDVLMEEQGKIRSLATTEINFSADYLDYMSEWARRYEGEIIQSDRVNEHIFLFKQAIGVTTGILPWNFPFFLSS